MSKINLLSSKIYNRIAAGEVVERPASAVKELVENSIDAGAKNIAVEIRDGGLSSITVTDDGGGIEKSQLKKALLPHATSKISTVEDLDAIATLGFRGEALASIASVSKIKILSKPYEQDFGASVYSEGGEEPRVCDEACDNGTEITVNNLFFNAPVRAKFLKTPKSEENEIASHIARFILGNPDVAFKFTADGKVLLQSFGDGLESAFVCVYGASTVKDCFYIDTEKNGIKIKGYIGKHYFTKSNRTYQTVFINGRYVVNQTVASSLMNAYSHYLMKRQYPFYVLLLELPKELVDVNVHPNKIDVRFMNNQIIYGSIYSVVSKVLDGTSDAINIVVEDKKPQNTAVSDGSAADKVIKPDFDKSAEDASMSGNVFVSRNGGFMSGLCFNDVGAPSISEDKNDGFTSYKDFIKQIDVLTGEEGDKKEEKGTDIFAQNKAYIEELERKKAEAQKEGESKQIDLNVGKSLKVIGQALKTFLILEDGADLYFIDQHAAHERILFDRINASFSRNEIPTQPLLLPYILNVNNAEKEFLTKKSDVINGMGIEFEEFGDKTFKVSAVPAYLSEMNLDKFFKEIIGDMNELKEVSEKELLFDRFAKKACRSAIKSGDVLSQSEIDELLKALNGNMGLKCPHGRPVAIKITRAEIDKWFKRIV